MAYDRIYWNDGSEGGTPLSAENLNIMDKGIDDLDNEKVPNTRTIALLPLSSDIGTTQLRRAIFAPVAVVDNEPPEEKGYVSGDFYNYNGILYQFDSTKTSGNKWVRLTNVHITGQGSPTQFTGFITGDTYTDTDNDDTYYFNADLHSWVRMSGGGGVQPKSVTISLPTANWVVAPYLSSLYTQTITISGSTANTSVDLRPTFQNIQALIDSNVISLYIQNSNGTLTAYSYGGKPTTDLSIQAICTEVSQ